MTDGRELGLAVDDAATERLLARLVVLDLLLEPLDVEHGAQLLEVADGRDGRLHGCGVHDLALLRVGLCVGAAVDIRVCRVGDKLLATCEGVRHYGELQSARPP